MDLKTLKDLNDLNSDNVLLVALDINIPQNETIHIVKNNENIHFKGNEYIAFPFELSELNAAKGEIPQVTLKVDNTTRIMQKYINNYDLYLKTQGSSAAQITAKIYILNSLNLDDEIFSESFELVSFKSDAMYVSFILGVPNLFNICYPPRKMYQNFCSFDFKDERCGYKGECKHCDKTLKMCKELKNSVRFGGFLGIGEGYKE